MSYKYSWKNKFYFKTFLIYTLILIVILSIVLVLSFLYVDEKNLLNAEKENFQSLQKLHNFFIEKNYISKRMIAQFYNYGNYTNLIQFLDNEYDSSANDTLSDTRLMNEYLQTSIILDNDIDSVAVINKDKQRVYIANKGGVGLKDMRAYMEQNIEKYLTQLKPFGVNYLSMYSENEVKYKYFKIPVIMRIKSRDMLKDVGYIWLNFSCKSIFPLLDNDYSMDNAVQYLALQQDGTVIFDSSMKYISKTYPFFKDINNMQSGKYHFDKPVYVECISDSDSGLVFIGVLQLDKIYAITNAQKRIMIIIFFICIALALSVAYIITLLFSKRIKIVMDAINNMRAGNLKTQIKIGKSSDEISMISENFNQMCIRLDEYINKVYISEIKEKEYSLKYKDAALKQKTSELQALQAQINPHFLYNALESIRMRAITCGNDDVAQMSYILASLFKQSIKKGMVSTVAEDINYCSMYMELIRMRYHNGLELIVQIDEYTKNLAILRHIIQPIIENSVHHGFDTRQLCNSISVKVFVVMDQLNIVIEDNGKGISKQKLIRIQEDIDENKMQNMENIGIKNVNHRIKLIFGERFGLEITSEEGLGTKTILIVPVMTEEELNKYVQGFNC